MRAVSNNNDTSMIAILSPAKTFASKPLFKEGKAYPFMDEALPIAELALSMNEAELMRALKLSPKLAAEARQHWRQWLSATSSEARALAYYSGMVFKKIGIKDFDEGDWVFAEEHLRLCSFVYGLLSPETLIRPYRMEGTVRMEDGRRVFDYWRDSLTTRLIETCRADDGVLINLASDEMQGLFHWDQVVSSLKVINCHFETRQADGSLKTIVIYCKMARGAMARALIKQRMRRPEELQAVAPEGFVYAPELSSETDWHYVLEA